MARRVRPLNVRDAQTMTEDESADLVCPRCQQSVIERFYGPCDQCRQLLRSSQGGTAHHVVPAEYEPKMNVTPNAVASKD